VTTAHIWENLGDEWFPSATPSQGSYIAGSNDQDKDKQLYKSLSSILNSPSCNTYSSKREIG